MIIGLTGVIASGKSAVSSILTNKGYKVIDCDKIVHNLYNNDKALINKINSTFNLGDNDYVDRKKLKDIIFNDDKKRELLNSIVHKKVYEEIKKQTDDFVFLDAPLLFEAGFDKYVDLIVVIYSTKDLILERMQKRDNISYDYANKILNSQIDIDIKKDLADYVIYNMGNLEDLKKNVEKFIEDYKNGNVRNKRK